MKLLPLPLRLLALVSVLILSGCATPAPAPGPVRPSASPLPARVPDQAVQLIIEALPDGAQVSIDGQVRGSSPLTLTLPAGKHQIALAARGYAPFSETITLDAGREALYSPELDDVEPPAVKMTTDAFQVPWLGKTQVHAAASDNTGVVDIELALGDQTLLISEGSELAYDLAPASIAGTEPGRTYTLTVTATDAAGNTGQAQLPLVIGPKQSPTPALTAGRPTSSPTPTRRSNTTPSSTPPSPTPTASPTSPPAVNFQETKVTIPTYPYKPFLRQTTDPSLGDYGVWVLDRAAYEASDPKPAPVDYTLLVLENRYLRLSILPGLGGRIYEVVFKPTGNNELYRNPVIKPTKWGPPSPPYPAGANWWLAAGGIEWGFPVEEHGYEWGKDWGYDTMRLPDGSVTVSVLAGDSERPYATVDITLAPEVASFTVEPTITNPTAATARVKWWANAMLAPGAANAPGPELRFIFPVNEMTVHNTGDETLPGPGQPMTWPMFGGRDMSRLGNWEQYLGFFERPAAAGDFMGAYDTAADEGMLRIYPSAVARGAKGFAMGWRQPVDPGNWTDDNSGYVELHGGLVPTFDDGYELPAGSEVSWSETWYPVADIGGVTYAATGGALHLAPAQGSLRISLFPTMPVRGEVRIALPGMGAIARPAYISPAQPFDETIPLAAAVPAQGEVAVTLIDSQGKAVFEYRGEARLR